MPGLNTAVVEMAIKKILAMGEEKGGILVLRVPKLHIIVTTRLGRKQHPYSTELPRAFSLVFDFREACRQLRSRSGRPMGTPNHY